MTESTLSTEAPSYQAQVQFGQPPQVVFDAFTSLSGLAGWWSPVTGSATVGGQLRFTHAHSNLVIHVDAADHARSVD
jgi:uncharacterized protein YndB with AHSA1/START domain